MDTFEEFYHTIAQVPQPDFIYKSFLGSGESAYAYKVYDSSLGKDIALKLSIHEGNNKLLIKENDFMEELEEEKIPGIPRIYGNGTLSGLFYIMMEIAETTLGNLKEMKINDPDFWAIGFQLFWILYFLRSSGFVHGDLHVGNIMFNTSPGKKHFKFQIDGTQFTFNTPYDIIFIDFGYSKRYKLEYDWFGYNHKTSNLKGFGHSSTIEEADSLFDMWTHMLDWTTSDVVFDLFTYLKKMKGDDDGTPEYLQKFAEKIYLRYIQFKKRVDCSILI